MGIFSGIKNLFSGSGEAEVKAEEAVEYKGFSIIPAPMSEGGQYRVAATITQTLSEDEVKTHNFIRSDLIPNRDECISITLRKAKMMIDQQGDRIFS
ncbi:transcriptional regulator [Marinomonas sp. S3726]|uniref:HlyU family transcriptional regulator n=1 Tax=Marinomonas sp. S3726 TaxID=579484 RepID=UPI0005FA5D63|nr:HlyU family transcriptional regulator [Marinomonas sp. S3726]KJZ16129.1 transcriptional regulator [Marinomonas sp. S3726]